MPPKGELRSLLCSYPAKASALRGFGGPICSPRANGLARSCTPCSAISWQPSLPLDSFFVCIARIPGFRRLFHSQVCNLLSWAAAVVVSRGAQLGQSARRVRPDCSDSSLPKSLADSFNHADSIGTCSSDPGHADGAAIHRCVSASESLTQSALRWCTRFASSKTQKRREICFRPACHTWERPARIA